MRHVAKGRPPRALVEFGRKNPGGRWDDAPKQAVRKALHRDQGGLCAYCTRSMEVGTVRVEHVVARELPGGAGRRLDWTNLVGCCRGDEALPPKQQTCDVHKRSTALRAIDPLDHPERLVVFSTSGAMRGTTTEANHDVVSTLNLNASQLLLARKAAMDGLTDVLGAGTWGRSQVERLRARHVDGDLRDSAFQPALVWYLDRVLRRRP